MLVCREREIEQALRRQIRKAGGLCLKFVSPGYAGMPDRICLLPNGEIFFVEVKAPWKKPDSLHLKRHEQLRALGFKVFVFDGGDMLAGAI